MGRSLLAATLVRAQVDLYSPGGGFSRAVGVPASQVRITGFVDNGILFWPLTDGSLVQDSSISAGQFYFNEIAEAPGFYSVRFFPDRVGYWRLVVSDSVLASESVLEFDVAAAGAFGPPNGLNASFIGG